MLHCDLLAPIRYMLGLANRLVLVSSNQQVVGSSRGGRADTHYYAQAHPISIFCPLFLQIPHFRHFETRAFDIRRVIFYPRAEHGMVEG